MILALAAAVVLAWLAFTPGLRENLSDYMWARHVNRMQERRPDDVMADRVAATRAADERIRSFADARAALWDDAAKRTRNRLVEKWVGIAEERRRHVALRFVGKERRR